jgi:uncharacterized FlaG/YvyC family protein
MDVQPAPNVGASVPSGSAASAPATTVTTDIQSTPFAPQEATSNSQTQQSDTHEQGSTIAPAVAKLFGSANAAATQLSVSYRVEGRDVVTVFTDPTTHKEVAQFPPELLIGLAQFFDQQSGVTFDKSA